MTTRSPLAPDKFPDLPTIDGLGLAVAASGLKYKNRDDLLLMTLSETATVAGVFTRSDTAAAPVIWSRKVVASGRARAILTNAGNANAFTGDRGRETVQQTSMALSKALGVSADHILLASTGVIGEPLEAAKLSAYFPQLVANQNASWDQAAEAKETGSERIRRRSSSLLSCSNGRSPESSWNMHTPTAHVSTLAS